MYSQIPSLPTLQEKLNSYMVNYNEMIRGGALDLVFFKDAMTHLVKVIIFSANFALS